MRRDIFAARPSLGSGRPRSSSRSLGYLLEPGYAQAAFSQAAVLSLATLHATTADIGLPLAPPSSLFGIISVASQPSLSPAGGASAGRRQRELQWLKLNRQALLPFVGQWVAIEGNEVIAHGLKLPEVVKEAKGKGVRSPFVQRVEPERPRGIADMGV